MRLHRFFISQKLQHGREILIEDLDLIHQLKSVFRLEAGDEILLLDNTGFEYKAGLTLVTKDGVRANILEEREDSHAPKRNIHLFISLIKKGNLEWVLEKGTELGVAHFSPVVSERSEKKGFNIERGAKIVKEASEQSGKTRLPLVDEAAQLENALKIYGYVRMIACDPRGEKNIMDGVREYKEGEAIGILVGPEGGWTDGEIEFFKRNNIQICTLGEQILRAETAAIAVSALLLL